MPPQGPPGPQAQQAPLPAAAATSAPAPVHPLASPGPAGPPGPGAAAASTDGGDAGTGAGLAGLAGLAGNNTSNCSSHDQPPALRKRRAADTAGPAADDAAPDTGELPCPVQDGAKGTAPTMLTTPAGGSGNGCAQGGHGGPGTPPAPVPESPATPAPSSTTPACPHDPHDNDEPKEPKLLTFHDVPQHLQFNPYIVNGYRPMSNFWGSLRSLFYLHNETVNIVTHGIPIVYILLVVPGLVPWARLDRLGRFLAWCHLVGAVSPWVGSFVYHLFMNLQAGERVYNRLLRLDMFGIWICQSFGALPMVTATVFCLPWNVRWFVISSYCMLSLCGLYKAMTAWSPWDRRLSFALPWVSRLVLCLVRACLGGGSPNNMLHLILQDGVSLVGGVVGAVYFPEKYFPGMVDYCLNSHNIMHVLTVAAVYSMHCATMLDLEWIASVDCKPAGPPWPPWPVWQPVANRTEL